MAAATLTASTLTLDELQDQLHSVLTGADIDALIMRANSNQGIRDQLSLLAASEEGVRLLITATDNGIGGVFKRPQTQIPPADITQVAQQFGVTEQNVRGLLSKVTTESRELALAAAAVSINDVRYQAQIHTTDGTVLWDRTQDAPEAVLKKAKRISESQVQSQFEKGLAGGMALELPANGKVSKAQLIAIAEKEVRAEESAAAKIGHGAQHLATGTVAAAAGTATGILGAGAGLLGGLAFGIPRCVINAIRHHGAKSAFKEGGDELARQGRVAEAQAAYAAAGEVSKGFAGLTAAAAGASGVVAAAAGGLGARKGVRALTGSNARDEKFDDKVNARVAGYEAAIGARNGVVLDGEAPAQQAAAAQQAQATQITPAPETSTQWLSADSAFAAANRIAVEARPPVCVMSDNDLYQELEKIRQARESSDPDRADQIRALAFNAFGPVRGQAAEVVDLNGYNGDAALLQINPAVQDLNEELRKMRDRYQKICDFQGIPYDPNRVSIETSTDGRTFIAMQGMTGSDAAGLENAMAQRERLEGLVAAGQPLAASPAAQQQPAQGQQLALPMGQGMDMQAVNLLANTIRGMSPLELQAFNDALALSAQLAAGNAAGAGAPAPQHGPGPQRTAQQGGVGTP